MVRQSSTIKEKLEKIIALYVRLSRDDDNEGDSNSISHQIEILTKYCRDRGITNYKIYKDDGYSGTSFQRPGFLEMLADIEAGLVGTVIVKDMSRFGRNYLEVGLYTEIRFPEMGVRFIAVNDGVDSDNQMDNDFTPFRNIINEWYAKDTSKKIRAVFRNKGMAGERLGGIAPYGYFRSNGSLVIDEETAPVVKQIFQLCAEGNGPGVIARKLREQEIPTPGTLAYQREGKTNRYHPDRPCYWATESIISILNNDVYVGRTTNFKSTKLSYKSKKHVKNPPEKQVTFDNTHEAIIDLETWELAQKSRESRKRPIKRYDGVALFAGMLFCADCGYLLSRQSRTDKYATYTAYTCGKYKAWRNCTAHYISESVLKVLVLQNLQRVIAYAQEDEDEFVRCVVEKRATAKRAGQEKDKRRLDKCERRAAELDTIIQKLYEDNVKGKLTDERFSKLSAGYEEEQAKLSEEIKALRSSIIAIQSEEENAERFLKIVRKYTDPKELTPIMLHELVEKIIVHEADKSSGHRVQKIDVHYAFIGEIDFSPEYQK